MILPSYGDYDTPIYIRIPYKPISVVESKAGLFFVAQLQNRKKKTWWVEVSSSRRRIQVVPIFGGGFGLDARGKHWGALKDSLA